MEGDAAHGKTIVAVMCGAPSHIYIRVGERGEAKGCPSRVESYLGSSPSEHFFRKNKMFLGNVLFARAHLHDTYPMYL